MSFEDIDVTRLFTKLRTDIFGALLRRPPLGSVRLLSGGKDCVEELKGRLHREVNISLWSINSLRSNSD